jgi:hypothetical protein
MSACTKFKEVTRIDASELGLLQNNEVRELVNDLVVAISKGDDVPDFCRIHCGVKQYMLVYFPLSFVHILLVSSSKDKYAHGITFIRACTSWLSEAEDYAHSAKIFDALLSGQSTAELDDRWATICEDKTQRVIEYFNRAWDMCLTDRCAE